MAVRFSYSAAQNIKRLEIGSRQYMEEDSSVLPLGVKPNGKLLETNMEVKACGPPLLHGAFQCSRCPPAPLPE